MVLTNVLARRDALLFEHIPTVVRGLSLLPFESHDAVFRPLVFMIKHCTRTLLTPYSRNENDHRLELLADAFTRVHHTPERMHKARLHVLGNVLRGALRVDALFLGACKLLRRLFRRMARA